MEHLSILATKNKVYATAFLRGLMAADGSAIQKQYKNYKTLSTIDLAVETHNEVMLYKKILMYLVSNSRITLLIVEN